MKIHAKAKPTTTHVASYHGHAEIELSRNNRLKNSRLIAIMP